MTDPYNSFAPDPVHGSFLMAIEDIFTIKGRGIVGTGRIERGMVHAGDPVEIVGRISSLVIVSNWAVQ